MQIVIVSEKELQVEKAISISALTVNLSNLFFFSAVQLRKVRM